ncbi:MAG: hypothetical protein PHX44_06665 [Sulfurimonas sp.]|uniref:hypothetical protein n=1 Tax=Sulfurimonas sp. TaxID=2022749 RepID=UPI0026264841|nr:hypothetical protein [Sulfurimonas sp.]MDD2652713.1 hypothetical protein [Sulfurimonas sp.]MDD3450653.1 hypothetical protein [Sulfurimonas sp.]
MNTSEDGSLLLNIDALDTISIDGDSDLSDGITGWNNSGSASINNKYYEIYGKSTETQYAELWINVDDMAPLVP